MKNFITTEQENQFNNYYNRKINQRLGIDNGNDCILEDMNFFFMTQEQNIRITEINYEECNGVLRYGNNPNHSATINAEEIVLKSESFFVNYLNKTGRQPDDLIPYYIPK